MSFFGPLQLEIIPFNDALMLCPPWCVVNRAPMFVPFPWNSPKYVLHYYMAITTLIMFEGSPL
jgi:hypothetical protein